METENKLLKDDVNNKQKLIDDMLEHNSNLMQAKNVFAQSNSATIVIPLETTLFEMIERMSQTFQGMTD